jgi:hypothetical protein
MENTFTFKKATKHQLKARMAIDGPSGSGKTYTALIAATALANGGKIAVIDTERGSASLYSDKFSFDVLELNTFSPLTYIEAIHAAEKSGYDVIVIDSLSHAWEGEGGALDMADDAAKRQKTPNSYTAWKEVTPIHRAMVDAMLQSTCHIVATMRSKMEYVQEKDQNGKTIIRKVGMAPIQRAGTEYEFTLVGDMDLDHTFVVSKSRCEILSDVVAKKPDNEFFMKFANWLNSGDALIKQSEQKKPEQSPEPSSKTHRGQDVTPEGEIVPPSSKSKFDEETFLRNFNTQKDFKPLPLDEAKVEESAKEGIYGAMTTEQLFHRMTAILKRIREREMTADETPVVLRKLAAIQTILFDRKLNLQAD